MDRHDLDLPTAILFGLALCSLASRIAILW